ncbi:Hypothetical predicted protein [Pelobates cultripes]|uniref:Uncharacterized protein n=1 Tax=Pelobates cultripes TaxID=61616 RepID=A0AAD1RUW5_PELCU|nr:Hypothetical predicted protein [Pelobates cultripes]
MTTTRVCITSNHPSAPPMAVRDYVASNLYSKIPIDIWEQLEAPFTETELAIVLETLLKGKSLGPDGLTARYFKVFDSSLSPHFLQTVNGMAPNAQFPPLMLRAAITVIQNHRKTQHSAVATELN